MNQNFHIDIDIEFEKIGQDQLVKLAELMDKLSSYINENFKDKVAHKVHGRNI